MPIALPDMMYSGNLPGLSITEVIRAAMNSTDSNTSAMLSDR